MCDVFCFLGIKLCFLAQLKWKQFRSGKRRNVSASATVLMTQRKKRSGRRSAATAVFVLKGAVQEHRLSPLKVAFRHKRTLCDYQRLFLVCVSVDQFQISLNNCESVKS